MKRNHNSQDHSQFDWTSYLIGFAGGLTGVGVSFWHLLAKGTMPWETLVFSVLVIGGVIGSAWLNQHRLAEAKNSKR